MTKDEVERLEDICATTNQIVTANGSKIRPEHQAVIIAALIQKDGLIEAGINIERGLDAIARNTGY